MDQKPRKKFEKLYGTNQKQIKAEDDCAKTDDDFVLNTFKALEKLKTLKEIKNYWKKEGKKSKNVTKGFRFEYRPPKSKLNFSWTKHRLENAIELHLPGKSMTEDIDPEFFQITLGRPIKENKKLSQYIKDIRNCFLTRLMTAFHEDEIITMNECHRLEKEKLNKFQNQFFVTLKGFEDFLQDDYTSSRILLNGSQKETEKSKEKFKILNNLKNKLKEVEAEILVLEEEWRKLKMFQKFLYVIAPSDWRKANDPNYGKSESSGSVMDPCLFDEFREETITDFQSKISKFLKDVEKHQAPLLYFTDSQQILNILTELETNNLRALNHCNDLDFPANNVFTEMTKVKARFEHDQKKLEDDIKHLENLVKIEEEKAAANEQNLRSLTRGLFRDLITNEEYLSLTAFLEDVYEDAVGITDADLNLVTMIKDIETEYENLLLTLDIMPKEMVMRTTKEFYKEQKRELKEAKDAERKVHQMEMLLKRFSRAIQVTKKGKINRKMAPRSKPPEEQLSQKKELKLLTEEQREQICLFQSTSKTSELYRPLCL